MSDDLANIDSNRKPFPDHWKLRTGLPEAHHEEGALLPPLTKKALPAGPKEIDLPAPMPMPVIEPAAPVAAIVSTPAAPVINAPEPVASIAPASSVPVVAPPPIPEPIAPVIPAPSVVAPPPTTVAPAPKQVMPVPHMFKGNIEHPIARAPQVIPFATKTPTLFKTMSAVYTQPLGRADVWLPWMRTSQWPTAKVSKNIGDVDIHNAHAGLPALAQKQVPPPASLPHLRIKPSVAHEKLSSLRVEDKDARMKQRANTMSKFSLGAAIGRAMENPKEKVVEKLIEAPAPLHALPPVDIDKLVEDAVAKKVAEVLAKREKVSEEKKIAEEKTSVPIAELVEIAPLVIETPSVTSIGIPTIMPVTPEPEPEFSISPAVEPIEEATTEPVPQLTSMVVAETKDPVPFEEAAPAPEPVHVKTADEILHEALASLTKKAPETPHEGRPVKLEIKMSPVEVVAPVIEEAPVEPEPIAPEVSVPQVQVSAPVIIPEPEHEPEPEEQPQPQPEPEPYIETVPAPASPEVLTQVAASAVDSWDDMLFGLPISNKA